MTCIGPTDLRILAAVMEVRAKGRSIPSYRELMVMTGRSLNAMVLSVNRLHALGLLNHECHESRAITALYRFIPAEGLDDSPLPA